MKKSSKLRVAMMTPPWLKMPPAGYGGIENVVHALVVELQKLGVTVELFATGDTTTPVDKLHWCYAKGQYEHIQKPLYEAAPITVAQVLYGLSAIKADGNFDIIHDHNGFIGPAAMAHLDATEFPPVLHTLHGPPFSNAQTIKQGLPDNRPMYRQFGSTERLYFTGISEALLKTAPSQLKPRLLPAVYNAVEPTSFPFREQKHDYFITLARFSRDKGQAVAARLCEELGQKLRMGGIIGTINSPRQLLTELANPASPHNNNPDFIYFREYVLPYLDPGWIEYVGGVSGPRKLEFLSLARALLFPIDWDEPFGMAPIEALACGTPVVAFRRGAMPEIIEHGKTGFLADTQDQFKQYMTMIDQIDPEDCRRSVEKRFSARVMAETYINRYHEVLKRCRKP